MRIITVEEHFHHPEAVGRVLALNGPGPVVPDAGFGEFLRNFMPDQDSAERLGGARLDHMDQVGIDIQVVSHGANSPSSLNHPDAVELCRMVNNDLAQQISEHPTRFKGFATVPLYDPAAAADELKRCVDAVLRRKLAGCGTFPVRRARVRLARRGRYPHPAADPVNSLPAGSTGSTKSSAGDQPIWNGPPARITAARCGRPPQGCTTRTS